MNRRNRALVVVGLAVVLALLASFGVYRAVQQIPVREVQIATTHAVVAKDRIPVGTLLTAGHVQVVAWPEASPLQGGFTRIEDVVGRGVVADVVPNEPITEVKLAAREAGAGLPPLITPGMRAVSVKVNDVIGVAGFTAPGTRVDVLVTFRSGQESMSRTVASNVQVLAAGTRADQDKARTGQAAAAPSTVVTLLVTPSDAERIALAQTDGQVMLALRNPLDVGPTDTAGVRMSALAGAPAAAPVRPAAPSRPRTVVAAPPAPPPPPLPYTVETIRGAKRTEETVR